MKRYLTQSSFLVPGGTLITATRGRTRAGVWRLRLRPRPAILT